MRIDNLQNAESFIKLDGSEIREVAGPASDNAVNQSLAEAGVPVGGQTFEHFHRESEEIYFFSGTPAQSRCGCCAAVRPRTPTPTPR